MTLSRTKILLRRLTERLWQRLQKEREPLLFPVSIILQYLQNINLHEMEKQKIRWLTYIAVLELQDSLGFLSLSPGVEDDSDKASAKTSQS